MTTAEIRAKADPAALASIGVFESVCHLWDMSQGFHIDAEWVHLMFEIKEPYPLWRTRKLTHFKEFRDYVRNGKEWLVTSETARVMGMGNPSTVGAVYSCLISASMVEYMMAADKSMMDIFADSEKYAEDTERFYRMME